MAKRNINDRIVKALKPAQTGHYDLMDTVVPGFGVRVSASGRRTFMLVSRYPGSRNPTRRALGTYGVLSLEKARQKARDWVQLIHKGIDPLDEEDRQRRVEQLKRENSFAKVAEDFIAEKLSGERKGREVARDLRREFVPHWGGRPITEITDIDVLSVIKAKARTAPAQARNLLAYAKRLFGWAVDQRVYKLARSPCDTLKPKAIVGEQTSRDRILSSDELCALWRAATRTPYPGGPVYQLLILTGLRLNEVADASWGEFDLRSRLWVIPAERMKGRTTKAKPHAVPLTDEMVKIIDALPRFNRGNFTFATFFGEKPVSIDQDQGAYRREHVAHVARPGAIPGGRPGQGQTGALAQP